MDAEQLLVTHYEFVKATTASICRRYSIFGDDADDVLGNVDVRLVRDDYAAIKQCRDLSNFKQFLRVLIGRIALDWMHSRWGKWRPTAKAKRMGPAAVLLERLILRDGLTRDESIQAAAEMDDITESPEELMDRVSELRLAPRRRNISLDDQVDFPGDANPSADVVIGEGARRLREILEALHEEVEMLDAESKLLIKMKYFDGLKGKDIAEVIGDTEARVFRRMYRVIQEVRARLEARRITRPEIQDVLEILQDDPPAAGGTGAA